MSSLNLSKAKDQTWFDLAQALEHNKQLVSLDLRGNQMSELCMVKILGSLVENFVLSELFCDMGQGHFTQNT